MFMFDPYQLTNCDWGCFAILIVKVDVFYEGDKWTHCLSLNQQLITELSRHPLDSSHPEWPRDSMKLSRH